MNQKKTKIIGLTGGIATGKSTVTKILRQKKIPVICADQIAHDVVKVGTSAYKKVIKVFGKDILKKNKQLNRQKIANLIFTNPNLKKKLEAIIHPQVRKEMKKQIANHCKQKKPIIFLDIPLLFESGLQKICEQTICITSSQKLQIERLKKFRGMTRQEALERINSQMPLKEKIKKADYTIQNNGSLIELKQKLEKILGRL